MIPCTTDDVYYIEFTGHFPLSFMYYSNSNISMYVSILFITTLENISLIQRGVKFSLWLAFMSFAFIRLPLLCHVTSVFEVSSKGPPPLVSLYVKQGVQGTCSSPVVVVKFKAMWIYRSQLVFRSKQTPPPQSYSIFSGKSHLYLWTKHHGNSNHIIFKPFVSFLYILG